MLSTLNILDRAGLTKKASPIPNIPLVLSLIYKFVRTLSDIIDQGERQAWPYQLIALAKKCELEISGVYNIEETLEEYDEAALKTREKNAVYKKEGADKFGFLGKVRRRSLLFPSSLPLSDVDFSTVEAVCNCIWKQAYNWPPYVGGDHFDITKRTKAEREVCFRSQRSPGEDGTGAG